MDKLLYIALMNLDYRIYTTRSAAEMATYIISTYIQQRQQAKQHGVRSETRSYQRANRLSLVPKMDPTKCLLV
jgi:hypothetical protein